MFSYSIVLQVFVDDRAHKSPDQNGSPEVIHRLGLENDYVVVKDLYTVEDYLGLRIYTFYLEEV